MVTAVADERADEIADETISMEIRQKMQFKAIKLFIENTKNHLLRVQEILASTAVERQRYNYESLNDAYKQISYVSTMTKEMEHFFLSSSPLSLILPDDKRATIEEEVEGLLVQESIAQSWRLEEDIPLLSFNDEVDNDDDQENSYDESIARSTPRSYHYQSDNCVCDESDCQQQQMIDNSTVECDQQLLDNDYTQNKSIMMRFFLEESEQLSSLESRASVLGRVPIAIETNLHQTVQYMINLIFGIRNGTPQLNQLPEVVQYYNKTLLSLTKFHSAYAASLQRNAAKEERSVIQINPTTDRVTLCKSILDTKTDEDEDVNEEESPDYVAAAVSSIRECNAMLGRKETNVTDDMLRKFMTPGYETHNVTWNMNALWIMFDILNELRMSEILSQEKMADVQILAILICPGDDFNATEKVFDYLFRVVHPGLRSEVLQQRQLANNIMKEIMNSLQLVRASRKMRKRILEVYGNAKTKSITGDPITVTTGDVTSDYFSNGDAGARARKRIIVVFFFYFAYDNLMPKLENLFGKHHMNCNLICLSPDKMRTAFVDEFFDMSSNVIPEGRKNQVRKIVEPVTIPVSAIKKRHLLVDSVEEINALKDLMLVLGRTINSS